ERAPGRSRPSGTPAGGRLRGSTRGVGRPAGGGASARSPAARVPPRPHGTGARDPASCLGRPLGGRPATHVRGGGPLARGQSDAGPARGTAGAHVPRAVPAPGQGGRPGPGETDPGRRRPPSGG